jgi:hypothetical protein
MGVAAPSFFGRLQAPVVTLAHLVLVIKWLAIYALHTQQVALHEIHQPVGEKLFAYRLVHLMPK